VRLHELGTLIDQLTAPSLGAFGVGLGVGGLRLQLSNYLFAEGGRDNLNFAAKLSVEGVPSEALELVGRLIVSPPVRSVLWHSSECAVGRAAGLVAGLVS